MTNNSVPAPPAMPGLGPLSRRGFLRVAAVGGMAFTTGCARLLGKKEAPEALVYRSLNRDEVDIITKLTEIMLPTERHGLPSSIDVVPTVANVDAMVAQMAPTNRDLLALGLWFLEHRPVVSRRLGRFTQMNQEKATRYLEDLQAATFFERGLITSIKALVAVNYWRDARTWPALDYYGPVTEIWGVRRLGNAPLPKV